MDPQNPRSATPTGPLDARNGRFNVEYSRGVQAPMRPDYILSTGNARVSKMLGNVSISTGKRSDACHCPKPLAPEALLNLTVSTALHDSPAPIPQENQADPFIGISLPVVIDLFDPASLRDDSGHLLPSNTATYLSCEFTEIDRTPAYTKKVG